MIGHSMAATIAAAARRVAHHAADQELFRSDPVALSPAWI
jgi:hypothetical protein